MNKIILFLVSTLAFSTIAFADEHRFIDFKPAVGAGSLFGEETETFDAKTAFATFRLNAINLPFASASSGISVEVNFNSRLFTAVGTDEMSETLEPSVLDNNSVGYTLWSLNRADIVEGKVYGGADMKFVESGSEGVSGNFDLRLVSGIYLGNIMENVHMTVEFYALEEDRPIAFAVLLNF